MEKGPLVIKIANSFDEMVSAVANAISYLDKQVFGDVIPVTITNNPAFANKGLAGFLPKRWLFKLFGMKDEYMIFTKSRDAEELRKRPFAIVGISMHEVRHRYQRKNPKCLISLNFARTHPLHFNQQLVDVAVEFGKKYKSEHLREVEFDAAMIEWIFNTYHMKKGMGHDVILNLITCDENSVLQIISKLKYSK